MNGTVQTGWETGPTTSPVGSAQSTVGNRLGFAAGVTIGVITVGEATVDLAAGGLDPQPGLIDGLAGDTSAGSNWMRSNTTANPDSIMFQVGDVGGQEGEFGSFARVDAPGMGP